MPDEPTTETTTTTPPAAVTDPPANTSDDGGDDWLSALPEKAQKEIKKLRSESMERRGTINELKTKLTEKEKSEVEAQRKRDEENGNWKNVAESEQKKAADLENKLRAKDERLMRAELRNAAIKEGIIDASDVDLFGLDGLSLDDNSDVLGVEKKVKELKKMKPHLFKGKDEKTPEGTTQEKQPPAANSTAKTKNAMEMTAEEFKEAERKLVGNSRTF